MLTSMQSFRVARPLRMVCLGWALCGPSLLAQADARPAPIAQDSRAAKARASKSPTAPSLRLRKIASFGAQTGALLDCDVPEDGRLTWLVTSLGRVLVVRWTHGKPNLVNSFTCRARRVRVHPSGRIAVVDAWTEMGLFASGRRSLRVLHLRKGTVQIFGKQPESFAWSRDGQRFYWVEREASGLRRLHAAKWVHDGRKNSMRVETSLGIGEEPCEVIASARPSECWINLLPSAVGHCERHLRVDLGGVLPRMRRESGRVVACDVEGRAILAVEGKVFAAGRWHECPADPAHLAVSHDRKHIAVFDPRRPRSWSVGPAQAGFVAIRVPDRCRLVRLRALPDCSFVAYDDNGGLQVWRRGRLRSFRDVSRGVCRVIWSADESHVAARTPGAVVVADRRGRVVRRFDDASLIDRSDAGSRFVRVGRRRVTIYDARRNAETRLWSLPSNFEPVFRSCYERPLMDRGHQAALFATLDSGRSLFLTARAARFMNRPFLFRQGDLIHAQYSATVGLCSDIEPLRLVKHPFATQLAMIEAVPPIDCGTGRLRYKYFGALRIYDREARLVAEKFSGAAITAAAYSPSGAYLAVASDKLEILETRDYTRVGKAFPLRSWAPWLAFVDRETLMLQSKGGLEVWKFDKQAQGAPPLKRLGSIDLPIDFASVVWPLVKRRGNERIAAIDLSPEGTALAVGVGSEVHLFEVQR